MRSDVKTFNDFSPVQRLFTLIAQFDLATGGLPLSKFTLLIGDRGSGKTLLSLYIASLFKDKKVLFLDFERTIDTNIEFVKAIVKHDNFYIHQPLHYEEALEVVDEFKEDVGLVIVDSLAMISSFDDTVDRTPISQLARNVNNFLRKYILITAKHSPTTILINQIRMNISAPAFLSSYTLPAGKFQEFIASLIIKMSQGKIEKKNDIPVYQEIQCVVEKSKLFLPKISFKLTFDLINKTFKDENFILEMLKQYNLLTKKSNKYELFGQSYQTQAEIRTALSNPSFKEQVILELMKCYHEQMFNMQQ